MFADPVTDACLVVPDGFEQIYQEHFSSALPSGLNNKESTIEIFQIKRIADFVNGTEMILQES